MRQPADRFEPLALSVQAPPLLLCFSHLRWDFVWQRPQHLMSRFVGEYAVLFWEEPIYDSALPVIDDRVCARTGVRVLTPHLPGDLSLEEHDATLRRLLDQAVAGQELAVAWYYTPMMLPLGQRLTAACVIYDWMDELANFKGAPPELLQRERELIGLAGPALSARSWRNGWRAARASRSWS